MTLINYYKKLVYLIPISLAISSFATHTIIILCSILFLIDTFRYKLFNYYKINFVYIFLTFFVLINISALLSQNILSFKYSIGFLRYGLLGILIFYILDNDKNFIKNFSYVLLTTVIFIVADAIIQLTLGRNIFLFKLQSYSTGLEYVTGMFGEEKKLGSFLARIFPLVVIGSILFLKKNKNKVFFLPEVLFILIGMVIIFTTERVALFIYLLFFFVILIKSKIFFKNKILWYLLITIIFSTIFLLNPEIYLKYKSLLYQSGIIHPGFAEHDPTIVKGGYDAGQIYYFSKFYSDQIINSYMIFKEQIFFGIGPKNYSNFLNSAWHPHNYYAQILSELGIFSFMLFLFVFIFLFFKFVKFFFFENLSSEVEEIKFIFITFFMITLLPIPNGDFFNSWLSSIQFLSLGFYLYYEK